MKYINIGKITSTHGLNGELKLHSSFSYIDRILKPHYSFYIGETKQKVSLLKYRTHNKVYLLTFEGFEDINLVGNFRNKDVYITREDLMLDDNELLFDDYIGLKSFYNSELLGVIKDIIDCGNNNFVFLIEGSRKILIPVNKNFISEVVKDGYVIFKNVEGLINAN